MKILLAVAVVSAASGAAIARLLPAPTATVIDVPAVASTSPSTTNIETRVAALEQALNQEREARQLLEDQLFALLSNGGEPVRLSTDPVAVDNAGSTDTRSSRRAERAAARSRDARAERLAEQGFDAGRVEWILRRESELQMAALQARYEAGRDGDLSDFYQRRYDSQSQLRAELGDGDYEKYLTAYGRPTDITVHNVIESSPAQAAGLRVGDRITNYDGARIYSMSDLSSQIIAGAAGENVVVSFVRDGQPMQVVLPRGPVGISGGR